jgi:hypothetical protein
MGQGKYISPYAWGTLLSELLEHDLAKLLSQADAKTLSGAEASTALFEQLRSFMVLKSTLKSCKQRPDVLQPSHEALLNFADRLFATAHQAFLNDAKAREGYPPAVSANPKSQDIAVAPPARFPFADKLLMAARQVLRHTRGTEAGEQPTMSLDTEWQPGVAVPSEHFLLEWQLVRLKAARERLILELADLSERHPNTFRQLKLTDVVGAEVESARLRVSGVWSKILMTASMSGASLQARKYAAGSGESERTKTS